MKSTFMLLVPGQDSEYQRSSTALGNIRRWRTLAADSRRICRSVS
eukprot:CAMPEP_0119372338 /NCGR_PEP_ID=MMETSP1334-20130426/18343_1 /TAXON_ID=127549 /ORGANISM="Calcidiscus leptoporus, Strain RCC1130" /LENGTH=44 /DNA_ID= /DNA_START= /DNA_END= /DNA_ORIENTATION=